MALQSRLGTLGSASRRPTSTCALPAGLKGLQQLVAGISGAQQFVTLQDSEPAFTQWLQGRGFASNQQKVVAQQLEGQGRGLVASAAVQKGELLLAVPRSLVIFPHTAAADSCLAPLLSQQSSKLPDWSLLALFLAEQQYLLRRDGVGSTAWGPYLRVLPQSPIGTVLDWTQKEVTTLLAGSGLLPKATTIRSAAELLWQDLQPIISTAQQQGLCPADMFSRGDIDWAVGICLSRSVRLDDLESQPIVLVPYADFLNHDVTCEAFLVWDQQQQAVVLRPDRSYRPGQQVFISYGPKSSGDLLLSYGFCPPAGSNPYDAAHLTFSIPATDKHRAAKQQALVCRDIPSSETFSVRIDALPAGLVPYLAFCAAELKSGDEAEALAEQLFDEGNLPVVHGISTEQIALAALAKQCKAALQGYPQKQEAGRELAADVLGGGGFEQRQALMAAIRSRERQILARTEFIAQQRIRELKRVKM